METEFQNPLFNTLYATVCSGPPEKTRSGRFMFQQTRARLSSAGWILGVASRIPHQTEIYHIIGLWGTSQPITTENAEFREKSLYGDPRGL